MGNLRISGGCGEVRRRFRFRAGRVHNYSRGFDRFRFGWIEGRVVHEIRILRRPPPTGNHQCDIVGLGLSARKLANDPKRFCHDSTTGRMDVVLEKLQKPLLTPELVVGTLCFGDPVCEEAESIPGLKLDHGLFVVAFSEETEDESALSKKPNGTVRTDQVRRIVARIRVGQTACLRFENAEESGHETPGLDAAIEKIIEATQNSGRSVAEILAEQRGAKTRHEERRGNSLSRHIGPRSDRVDHHREE